MALAAALTRNQTLTSPSCDPLHKPHWTHISSFHLGHSPGREILFISPILYIRRLRLKHVDNLPRFPASLISGEQTLRRDQNVSIIGSNIYPFHVGKYTRMPQTLWPLGEHLLSLVCGLLELLAGCLVLLSTPLQQVPVPVLTGRVRRAGMCSSTSRLTL